ncbi:MAG: MotA/TolQ/ExbB proton channel family protein [Verrucomicrobia bacterium]|nr:MotA/TolQ/ExbB proton channel family protein [Verrucomicrobiota bacterium]
MIEIFHKGGPIMWPLLLVSVVALTVVIERLVFIALEKKNRNPALVGDILTKVENGHVDEAARLGEGSKDFVVRALTYALTHREKSFSEAMLRSANWELKRFNRGLTLLDTAITLAPLLGLLGTVVGKIGSFNMLGGSELGAPAAITGGIAEALIATAFGLGIAITALLPFNYLNAREEEARLEIQDAASHVELHLKR